MTHGTELRKNTHPVTTFLGFFCSFGVLPLSDKKSPVGNPYPNTVLRSCRETDSTEKAPQISLRKSGGEQWQ